MGIRDKVLSGLKGFDEMVDYLRLGDNVVWQVDSIKNYEEVIRPYVQQAILDQRNIIYIRFGNHVPLFTSDDCITIIEVDASKGFEHFAMHIHTIIEAQGEKAFYVFDCLSDLLEYWKSDLMIGNFFKVTCPYLFILDTVAYFAIIRNTHTNSTIAGIRETTQLLLDLYMVNEKLYIHPLKVLKRYSPTMFFPHLIFGDEAISITASSEAAELFSSIQRAQERLDHWDVLFQEARDKLKLPIEQQETIKRTLMSILIGTESRMFALCDRYFTLEDILLIASREVGTGFIGGKSVGMLIARKILMSIEREKYEKLFEPHDSYYIGSDVFYTYIVQNGWWELLTRQKTKEGYFVYAPELKEKILEGVFPENIQEKFIQMLEYFGQSPIIVRSSSLLEDNFGNAFAGKYESVFCVNQGTPKERFRAFERAVRAVYASTMSEDALAYRKNRGLMDKDEQMAILVQRVSGDYYGDYFFPHAAGVGNSTNVYLWNKNIDMSAGMLRLVFGLGTRSVDRTGEDYAKIVTLDDPLRLPLVNYGDRKKFSQRLVDVLSLKDNALHSYPFETIYEHDLKTDKAIFFSEDEETIRYLSQMGKGHFKIPYLIDFDKLLRKTEFAEQMKDILHTLSTVYDYPVDIEFTINFNRKNQYKINLLQCRPLQTIGLGKTVTLPIIEKEEDCFFSSKGEFMGGNVRFTIDYVVYVDPTNYSRLDNQAKYKVARQIGRINHFMKGKSALLIGPGRWGTTTPSLGVPVHFTELCNMGVIVEVSSKEGFMPELSFGSHFFQDLVETGIFYVALFEGKRNVFYNPKEVLERDNIVNDICSECKGFEDVIHVSKMEGMEIYSDIVSQRVICK